MRQCIAKLCAAHAVGGVYDSDSVCVCERVSVFVAEYAHMFGHWPEVPHFERFHLSEKWKKNGKKLKKMKKK